MCRSHVFGFFSVLVLSAGDIFSTLSGLHFEWEMDPYTPAGVAGMGRGSVAHKLERVPLEEAALFFGGSDVGQIDLSQTVSQSPAKVALRQNSGNTHSATPSHRDPKLSYPNNPVAQ